MAVCSAVAEFGSESLVNEPGSVFISGGVFVRDYFDAGREEEGE